MNPEFSQAICSQWKGERNFNLSSRTNVCARWVFPSPFNLNICTVNCSTETEEIFWGKAALNLLVSRWSVPFEFSFCEGKTRFTHAIAANKRANSHNFKIKKLSLITITFLAVYLMNSVTAALRVTLRDMTETYVAVAWDRAVPDVHASRTFQNVFAELVLWVEHFYS